MSPAERRDALVVATILAIRQFGAMPTTRQIADAAGVAEGTIFRVFDTKDELRTAVLRHTFDPVPLFEKLSRVDQTRPLRQMLIEVVGLLHERLSGTFTVMRALGLSAPPAEAIGTSAEQVRQDTAALLQRLIEPHQGELTMPAEQFGHILRMLAFAGSHRDITHGRMLTAEQTVDVLLFGALRRTGCATTDHRAPHAGSGKRS